MPEQQIDPQLLDQTRREIGKLVAEIEQLANKDIPEEEFYAEYLRRILSALAAQSAALWIKTPHGNLQLKYQINLQSIGIQADDAVRQSHDELLRYALLQSKSMLVAPHSGPGDGSDGSQVTNPTPFLLVLAPIPLEDETVGVLEVFQDAARRSTAHRGYLHFLTRIASELTKYLKNRQLRQIMGREQLWNQLESYIRSVHGGLNPKQVAYLIANDGKKLIGSERVSVAMQRGRKTVIEAISGQDVVEKRSNLVQRMARLCRDVLKHGENLLYTGTIEEHWPRDIVGSLEEYLEESGSKLIAVVPMADAREFGAPGKARAAVVVEMIEDDALADQMGGKIEVVARHGAGALYNALEYHRIPLLPFWRALGASTESINASTMPKIVLALTAVVTIGLAMVLVPWPLRLEASGELVPETRRTIFAPTAGVIEEVKVDHGSPTEKGSLLVTLSNPELKRELLGLDGELDAAKDELRGLKDELRAKRSDDPEIGSRILRQTKKIGGLERQIDIVRSQLDDLDIKSPIHGQVMDWDPKETLTLRAVQQGDAILKVADVDAVWVIEVRIPENGFSHIADALKESVDGTLPVTYVLSASPDRTYNGRLIELATEAKPVDQENMIEAKIAIDQDDKPSRQLSGIEVRAKIDCGPHPVGYVLFRELIDFVREYVFF